MKSIKSGRLFLYVTVCVALIDILFVTMNYYLAERSFKQNMKAESESLYLSYQTLLSQTYSNLLTIATFVASDPKVQQLFSEGRKAVLEEGGGAGGDKAHIYRSALYELVGEKWKAVQDKFDARQLHFHLGPGSTSFLRVHKPEKYGDNMDNVRFTVVDVNQQGQPVTGFETGRVYSGLRGVVPVTIKDEVSGEKVQVGALEAGTSFEVILGILNQSSHYSAGVLLTKEHIQTAMWPEAIVKKFSGQRIACECVIEATSEDNFQDIITSGKAQGIRFRDGGHQVLDVEGRAYLVSYFPLRDYRGGILPERDDVGAVVFWKDASVALAELRSSQWYNILYGVIGFVLVELLFFSVLNLGTRRLENVIKTKTHELKVSKDRLSDVIWATGVGVWEWVPEPGALSINSRWAKMLGYPQGALEPLSMSVWEMLICPDDLPAFKAQLEQVIHHKGSTIHIEMRVRHQAGHWVWWLVKGRSVDRDGSGTSIRISGSCADVTERKQNELKVRHLATYDTLTGVYNRAVFNEKLNEMFSLSQRTGQPFAVMMFDLDGFKPINDQYGHPVGDILLKQVAADLSHACRDTDIVARLGGDEFALILPSTADKRGAETFAERVLKTIAQVREIDGHAVQVQASIGFCMFHAERVSAAAMMKAADAALYTAKQQGKNTVKAAS